jgi:hypothetical protein
VPIVANPNNDPACVAFQGAAVSAARQAKSAR